MGRRLPPLNALRAFEAAARHLSLSRAADELSVTPAAVSHQIRTLEDHLGVPLFRRDGRSLLLTDAGQACLPGIREGFERLSSAIDEIDSLGMAGVLTVSVAPSFAAKWLVPRLDRFLETMPGADVRIDVSSGPLDFEREDVDVAIRFGDGVHPGLQVDKLFHEMVFPVCSPELLKGAKPLREPRDLLQFTLIHLDWEAQGAVWPNWRMWMQAAGVKDFNDTRGLHFSQTSLALQAALDGHGVALGETTLAAHDIASGRLVKPFELSLRSPAQFGYHLITRRDSSDRPMTKAFRNWILVEAAQQL